MENIEAMLCAYIEGDLDEAGRAQIEKHLKENPQHRKMIQELMGMREMVRALPRVKAPADVGESLQLQAERAILLDDSPAAAARQSGGGRWSQFLAIAAVFLLCASLCLVLYRALGPTLKPPVFTEKTPANLTAPPAMDRDASQVAEAAKAAPPAGAEDNSTGIQGGANVSNPTATLVQSAAATMQQQAQQQMASPSGVDVETVRRRLANSGYGVAPAAGANSSPTVLMVVSSSNPSAASSQVTQFLTNNSGISWRRVPPDATNVNQNFQQQPAGGGGIGSGTGGSDTIQQRAFQTGRAKDAQKVDQTAGATKQFQAASPIAPATQPSSDVYVAKGLTPQQASELGQSLSAAQNGAECQVIMQSGAILATTQPSSLFMANGSVVLPQADESSSTTQPSASGNANSQVESATTAPSNSLSNRAEIPALADTGNRPQGLRMQNGLIQANQAMAVQEVDAVIIVQATSAPAATQPVATPAPVESNPATQPSPASQP
jgi:hypothetical protein